MWFLSLVFISGLLQLSKTEKKTKLQQVMYKDLLLSDCNVLKFRKEKKYNSGSSQHPCPADD
ncbi:hypothetical protein EXN66_Car000842 [Channa argus]|uniref:Uncharacterized protein n=1 Tax=Channa argus TaxID=215402 RepID=A0A6G1QZC1_CHAAH|nr:hypothetical protein EXN66_Car000842 [Channa argus]